MSTTARRINNQLITLSTVLPLISDSINSRANKCFPKNSNAQYAKSRLQAISGNKISEMHLQSFIDHVSSKKLKQSTPKHASTRKRKLTLSKSGAFTNQFQNLPLDQARGNHVGVVR